jgi:dipeptidyl aminopeptidase/acylaminoacyl peptidase
MNGRLGMVVVTGCAAAASLLMVGTAVAAFPGTNGKIAFVHLDTIDAPGDILAIDPDGQNLTPLTSSADDDNDPSYSPDGERIVFSRIPAPGPPSSQIWTMNHDGTRQTQLTSDGSSFNPAFSPDGERIAFQRSDPGTEFQIWIMNADGTGQTPLTFPGPSGDAARSPTFSPDGETIAFSHEDGATGFQEIWVMNADGSGQQRLTGPAMSFDNRPNFSPDGQRIVFERFDGSQLDLVVMNADGSGQAPVTSGVENDFDPVFSPDGAKIAFEREDAGFTLGNIFLADAAGLNQNLTPLTANPSGMYDFEPDWQPLNPPSCDLTGKAKQKSTKRVSLTVTCANENATVVAEGSGKAPKVPKGAVASKAKKFTIPAVTTQVPAGSPTTLTLKIPKKGKKALKKAAEAGKKGKATITADLTDDLGQTAQDSFSVRFKPKKK